MSHGSRSGLRQGAAAVLAVAAASAPAFADGTSAGGAEDARRTMLPRALGEAAAAVTSVLPHDPAASGGAGGMPGWEYQRPEGGGLREWFGKERRAPDAFDHMARPVTNIQFHHPFIWNELRPLFVNHWFPEESALGGGTLRAYAFQIFAKLSDEWQFTAYKDGYVDLDPDATVGDDKGFADFAVGFKWKAWEDASAPAIFSLGLGYELTTGDEEVLEGKGDLFDLYGSYARDLGPANFIGTAGFILPTDSDDAVRVLHWHMHLDIPLSCTFSPLVEMNAFHYMSDGDRNAGFGPTVPLGFEGFDYTNLGADDVKGNTVMTGALGFRWFISEDVTLGAAYEVPLTDREDVIDRRFTLDLTFRF
ncbi:MAG: hypothetical protein HMLKMBBP_00044 [Planctomycetes bacterium]|nr:hypothetical protein [Planctomycetota bacterium]